MILPGNLPAAVVTPCGFALDRRGNAVGYLMPKVVGEALHALTRDTQDAGELRHGPGRAFIRQSGQKAGAGVTQTKIRQQLVVRADQGVVGAMGGRDQSREGIVRHDEERLRL